MGLNDSSTSRDTQSWHSRAACCLPLSHSRNISRFSRGFCSSPTIWTVCDPPSLLWFASFKRDKKESLTQQDELRSARQTKLNMLFLQGCSADRHSTFNGYFLSESHFRTTNTHARTHARRHFFPSDCCRGCLCTLIWAIRAPVFMRIVVAARSRACLMKIFKYWTSIGSFSNRHSICKEAYVYNTIWTNGPGLHTHRHTQQGERL